MNDSHSKGWLAGFIMGVLVGSGTALLMAPRSGEKTRAMLAEKGMEVRDKAMNTVEDTRERVQELTSNVVDEARGRVEQLKDVGRQVGKQEADMIKKGAQDVKQALKDS